MFYAKFLSIAEAISPEDRDKYVLLQGWAGMDRAIIDSIDFTDGKVQITSKHIIREVFPIESLRIDEEGQVYLHLDLYKTFDPEMIEQLRREKLEEARQELLTHRKFKMPQRPESIDQPEKEVVPARVAGDPPGQRPHPEVPAREATGQQLTEIMAYQESLKTEGRSDEIGGDIAF